MMKSDLENILGFKVEATENPDFGDYTSNVAMTEYRKLAIATESHVPGGKKPGIIWSSKPGKQWNNTKDYAEYLITGFRENKELKKYIEKIEVAGSGFINFWIKKDVLVDNLIQISKQKEKYGSTDIGKGKRVVIDYSSPNIAKPFGIGHLRSTIIGAALYNLYKELGYEVVGDNHLGDWGTQFGKLLYMIDREKLTDFNIEKLEALYVEFHKLAMEDESLEEKARNWFKKLEEGDTDAKKIWKKCVDVSLTEFDRIYDMLDVKIDFAFGESYYESEMQGMMRDTAIQKHLSVGEDGAKIVNLEKFGIKTPLMFLKSDGATTYATRDLATLKFRERKWNPDIIIYEVGAEQTLHFQQVFAAAKFLGIVGKDVTLVHTAHGLYLAPDGKKFSTRKGKTIKLEEVLEEAINRAKKLGNSGEKVASEVGIGAIKYYDLMHAVTSNVVFDWEKMMNLEGNSGPYLQYTVARTNSVIAKSEPNSERFEASGLNEGELLILRALIKFNEVLVESATKYSPNLLCNYLYDLAQKFNAYYNSNRIIGSDNQNFRLVLTSGVSQVLKNGLRILGIKTPEKM